MNSPVVDIESELCELPGDRMMLEYVVQREEMILGVIVDVLSFDGKLAEKLVHLRMFLPRNLSNFKSVDQNVFASNIRWLRAMKYLQP